MPVIGRSKRIRMSPETQFWWTWGASVAVAVGTLSAVVVALFGDRIRASLFRPELQLRLLKPEGEETRVTLRSSKDGQEKMRDEDARYYHVQVTNKRRWPVANQVQVHLLRVEEPGPDNQYKVVWEGDVPLSWRHQEIHPLARIVGHAADCDLCSVIKGKWLQLHPLVVPFNLNALRREPTQLRVLLQARSVEADSKHLAIEISWDGQWADGEKEMMRHMVVREANSS